jgi:GTP-binding protein
MIVAITNNRALVKVSNRPGKTTEINYFLINKKFYLVDLPGYGFARVTPKEKEKLQKLIIWYLSTSGIALKKVVLIIDVRIGITEFDRQMIHILREQGHPFVVAANKIDKLSKRELAAQLEKIHAETIGGEVVVCSAIKRIGIDALVRTLFV